MKINLDTVKNIELCYENCEVDTIEQENLFGFYIQRRMKDKHPSPYKTKPSHYIKTFEIALQNIDYQLRTDLAQVTINYNNGYYDHFLLVWSKDDCSWDHSSLQKIHKKDNILSLTSNCTSIFLKDN